MVTIYPDGPSKLFVVDDEKVIRDTIRAILEREGYEVIEFATAEDAIASLGKGNVDLVLTDMHFEKSEKSGLDLVNAINEIDDTVPVILVTGFPSINTAVEAIKRGAVDYLTKPFERDRLIYLVSKALQERRLRRENQRLQAEVNKAAVIEKLNRELDDRIDELTRINRIQEELNEFVDTDALFERIVRLSAEVTGAERVSLMLLDQTRRYMRIRSAIGLPSDVIQSTRIRLGEGMAGQVAQAGRLVRTTENNVTVTSSGMMSEDRYATSSWLSIPLRVGEEIFGVINLTEKLDGTEFTLRDEHVMTALTEKAGIKLENQALYEGIYSNLVDTLNSLVTTLEAKDPYTRDHSQRVTDYAVDLARYIGLDEDQLEILSFAGMLHDIGKIGVRDEILTKNGRLTDEEFGQIQLHPNIGVKIVEPLGLIEDEISIIRHHHERFDGRGYPDKLGGTDIPLLSRIVAVTDAFDAMTTTRSYRNALPVATAMNELRRCKGAQFDPQLAEAMLDALAEGKINLDGIDPTSESQVEMESADSSG